MTELITDALTLASLPPDTPLRFVRGKDCDAMHASCLYETVVRAPWWSVLLGSEGMRVTTGGATCMLCGKYVHPVKPGLSHE